MNKVDVLLVGGGSGGHLTPLIPIAEELHKLDSNLHIAHIGQKNDPLNKILDSSTSIQQKYEVSAGKFRRYHGESWLKRMFDFKTNLLNVRDFFRFLSGVIESWILLGKLKPKAILAKGGYVGVPVGFAARLRKIPYITHDSDAMGSLANRIIAKSALRHATALPIENYKTYDSNKTIQVGVPVRAEFHRVTDKDQYLNKKKLGITKSSKLLLVVGGGLGARVINKAVARCANELISDNKGLHIVHITGQKLFEETSRLYSKQLNESYADYVDVLGFSNNLYELSSAADLIITRAGATNIAEFASQAKACIVVPNPLLSGGHQTKNASAYKASSAAVVVEESNLKELLPIEVKALFDSKARRNELGNSLNQLFVPDAASKIATILYELVAKASK